MTKIILLLLLLVGVEWNNAYQIFRNTGTLLRKISNIWGMYLVVFCHWHNKRLYEVGIRYEYAKYQRSWTTLFHVAWPERNFVTREHSKQQQPFIDSQTIDFIYIYIYIYIYICCVKKRYRKKAVFLHWYICKKTAFLQKYIL